MSLQLRPATNPYLESVTEAAAEERALTALRSVTLRVPVRLAVNWLVDVVEVTARLATGLMALLLTR
jgi:hypothetical protein